MYFWPSNLTCFKWALFWNKDRKTFNELHLDVDFDHRFIIFEELASNFQLARFTQKRSWCLDDFLLFILKQTRIPSNSILSRLSNICFGLILLIHVIHNCHTIIHTCRPLNMELDASYTISGLYPKLHVELLFEATQI